MRQKKINWTAAKFLVNIYFGPGAFEVKKLDGHGRFVQLPDLTYHHDFFRGNVSQLVSNSSENRCADQVSVNDGL